MKPGNGKVKKNKVPRSNKPIGKKSVNKPFIFLVPVLLISVFVFSPAFTNQFVNWDDYAYIVDNPVIKDLSWKNIAYIFNIHTHVVGNYHPLTVLSMAIEYNIVELKPFLYHLDNLLLHLLNICLVCMIVWKLSGKFIATLITTVLFAIHPMRVESVVWAAERKDVLYSFFFLLALLYYIRYQTYKDRPVFYYLLTLLFFIFSLLSKGQAVVLPFVLILIDYWEKRSFSARLILEKIPFLLLAIVFGLLATQAESNSLTTERMMHFTLSERFFYAGYNLIAYPFKLLWPYNLSCFYGYPYKENLWFVKLALPVVLIILGFIFYKFRKNRLMMFGVLYFLSTIFIVIQLLPIGNAIIADRYTYIPYLGLFFIIAMGIDQWIVRKPGKKKLIIGLLSIQLFIFAIASYAQSRTWKNSETLWAQTLKVNPREAIAHNNIGAVYLDQKDYEKAIEHFNQAIVNKENYLEVFEAYNNLGKACMDLKKYEDAITAYNHSLEITPSFAATWFDQGLCYSDMGKYGEAIADFTKFISLQPTANAYYSRGLAFKNSGKLDEAIEDYSTAIALKPDYVAAYLNRANAFFKRGNLADALANYDRVLQLDPSNGQCYLNLAKVNYSQGKFEDALRDYNRARQNQEEDPVFLNAIQQALDKK